LSVDIHSHNIEIERRRRYFDAGERLRDVEGLKAFTVDFEISGAGRAVGFEHVVRFVSFESTL
jgi:hypothetical protein